MPMLYMRLTGSADDARTLINLISSLEGIDSVEEVADLMPHMDDDDSSSAGLESDAGPGFHAFEIETSNETVSNRVRELAEAAARDAGSALEFVDEL